MPFFHQLFRKQEVLVVLASMRITTAKAYFVSQSLELKRRAHIPSAYTSNLIKHPTHWRVIENPRDTTYIIQPPELSLSPDPKHDISEWKRGLHQIKFYLYPNSHGYTKIHLFFGSEESLQKFKTNWEKLGHSGFCTGEKFFIEIFSTDDTKTIHQVTTNLLAILAKTELKWSNDSLHFTKELNSRKEVIYDRQKSEEKIYGRI